MIPTIMIDLKYPPKFMNKYLGFFNHHDLPLAVMFKKTLDKRGK